MPFSNALAGVIGFFGLIQAVVLLILVAIVWRERKHGFVAGTLIVLRHFRINEHSTTTPVIEVSGRLSGIVSWILTLLRVEPEFQLIATRDSVSITRESLRGTQHIFIPLNAVTATNCGYERSIWAFAFAVYFAFSCASYLLIGFLSGNREETGSNMGLAFGSLVIAGIGALVYFLSKKIGLSLASSRDWHGLNFKRSVVEGVSIELPQALKAIEVLNNLIISARTAPPRAAAAAAANFGAPSPASSPIVVCPKCGAVNQPGLHFCEDCGSPLT